MNSVDIQSWWIDEPITSVSSDLLDRVVFVDRVQALIDRIGGSSVSTVIGLVGPWGSGKTSTLNMIVEGLNSTRWGIARATPWALTGSESVISELMAGIMAALPNQKRRAEKARKALAEYGAFVTPALSTLPVVGDAVKAVGDAALARMNASTVYHQIEKVSAELERLAHPVLVVVDDIDRLQHEELLALFRAVRVLGRLPHVHYLLAYDEQTILDVLETTEIAKGRRERALAFLEKIVSLRLDQPPTRAEQAGEMLTSGLADVISENVGPALAENQRIRLDDEREALMSAIVTEPRTISRFLTQLRTYLPIIGASEIDFVDFSVITLLRLTYPQLFRELLHDKGILVGATRTVDDAQLLAWGNTDRLKDLGVPERHLTRVSSALQRLFPRLVPSEAAINLLDRDNRRRDRRASDPDYVDRYFALTAQTNELADAVIADALDEWATGSGLGTAAVVLRDELTQAPSDDAACGRVAQTIRRATARSGDLTPTAAGAVLRVILGYLPLPANGGVETAMISWVATLLPKVEHLQPAELLRPLERPQEEVSPLSSLLRAIRLVPTPSGGDSLRWWSRLTEQAAEAAWDRLQEHVQIGDDAPSEPIGFLLRWLEESIGPDHIKQRLGAVIDDGLPLADLAARLVEVGTGQPGTAGHLTPIDIDAFVRRLGRSRILRHRDELLSAASRPPTSTVNLEDLSWSNRKAVAASQLLTVVDGERLIGLPELNVIEAPDALLNHEPDLAGRSNGQDPDLKAQLTILMPAGSTVPALGNPAQGPIGQQREETALRLLKDAPITAWLFRTAGAWHVVPGDWQISDAEARSSTSAILVSNANWSVSDPGRQLPIRIGAQIRTGLGQPAAGDPKPVLILTIAIGFWLAELNADRLPDDVRHNERPLPAALSLQEAVELFAAMLASTSTAFEGFLSMVRNHSEPDDASVDLRLYTNGGLGGVIDLRDTQVIRDSNRLDHRLTIMVERTRSLTEEESISLAATTLAELLLRAGYRGYEESLLNIVQAKYD